MDLIKLKKKVESRTLMPLRVPHGWLMQYNGFFEMTHAEIEHNDVHGVYLVEDILWIEQSEHAAFGWSDWPKHLSIDLGWHPDGDSEGAFRLVAQLVFNEPTQTTTSNASKTIAVVESRDPIEIRTQLESWLSCSTGKDMAHAIAHIQSET